MSDIAIKKNDHIIPEIIKTVFGSLPLATNPTPKKARPIPRGKV